MTKTIGLPSFSIIDLPGGGGKWPQNLTRDSFSAQNERRGLREDRTGDVPIRQTIAKAAGSGASGSVDLEALLKTSGVSVNRLKGEVIVPALTPEQLAENAVLTVTIEGSETGAGGWAVVASVSIVGTGEDTEESEISYRPSVGSTVKFLRVAAARSTTAEKPAQVELRVYYDADQVRQKQWLTGHVACTTESTVSTAFQNFIAQTQVTAPVVYLGKPQGGIKGQVFAGAWVIMRADVEDNQNSSSLVRISMEKTGEWADV